MTNYKMKFVKSAAALALGASVITSAVVAGDLSASAKTTYKVSNGKLVNAKTKKAIKGYKVYKSVLYKDGKKFTGTYKTKYYKSGKLFTGKTSKGVYYKSGKKFNGTTSYGYYYKDGVRFTGKTSAGTYYKNGKKFNGTTSYGYYYINGKRAEGIVVVKGVDVLYKNGKVVADKTAPVITINGQKDGDKIELKNGAEFTTPKASVKDNVDSKVKVVTEIKDQDGKVIDAIDTKVGGTYTITYAAKDASGNTSAATITVEVAEGDFAVESVKAVNTTTATIEFNQKLDSIDKAAFTVTNKATGEKLVVKSATLSEDKKSATVELYSEVAANTTYTVDYKVGDITASNELTVGSLKAASITTEDQKVPSAKTAIKYKVFDEKGTDVTSLYPASSDLVSFESTSTAVNKDEKGYVTLDGGSTIKVKVVIKDGTTSTANVLAQSSEFSISAVAAVAASISNWTITGTENDSNAFPETDYKQVSTVVKGDKAAFLNVQLKDQYNAVATADVEYESQTPAVAIVDKTTGKITSFATGTAVVKVTVKSNDKVLFTKNVEIKVQDAAKATKVTLDNSAVKLSNTTDGDSTTVKATLVDQYGNALTATDVDYTITNADKTVVNKATVKTDDKGIATAELTNTDDKSAQLAAGTYTVEFKSGEATATATLSIVAPGAFTGYDVQGLESELDLNKAEKAVKTATPVAISVDANGVKIEDESTTVVVLDKDGKAFADGEAIAEVKTGVVSLVADKAKVGDKFQVVVKVGDKVIKAQTVTVKDTTVASTVDFNKYSVSGVVGANLRDLLNVKYNGKDLADGQKVTSITLASTDITVLDNDGKLLAAGTATAYVTSITVTTTDADSTPTNDEIKFATPVKISVTSK